MPTTTNYIWDEQNLLAEADGSNTIQTLYSNEPQDYGNLVSSRIGGTTSYNHFDGLGSTRQLTNSAGAVTDTVSYDAWGDIIERTGTTAMFQLWIGEMGYYYDLETGLFDVRDRTYGPPIGRWTATDPSGFIAGLNRYCYVDNAPIISADPRGRHKLLLSPTTGDDAPWCAVNDDKELKKSPLKPKEYGYCQPIVYAVECVCDCCENEFDSTCKPKKKVNCTVIAWLKIWINVPVAKTLKRDPSVGGGGVTGTYGHEQLHLQNLIDAANAALKAIENNAPKNCLGSGLCESKWAPEIQKLAQDILNTRKAIEGGHDTSQGSPPRFGQVKPKNKLPDPDCSKRGDTPDFPAAKECP